MIQGMIPALLVALAVIALLVTLISVRARRPDGGSGLYPEGHYRGIGMSLGISVGLMLGAGVGVAIENLAVGLAMGLALGSGLGVALGAELERRNQHKLRPLTPRERSAQTTSKILLIIAAGVTALALAATLFLLRA